VTRCVARAPFASLVLVVAAVSVTGCGGSSHATYSPPAPAMPTSTGRAAATSGSSAAGPGALQAEATATAAGDIPDNQVFLTFRDARAGYSMKYPEGWAQQGFGDAVTFRDKDNVIRAVVSPGSAWTRASVQGDVQALRGVRVQSPPQAITLAGRPAFKVVYRTVSAPNPVTGKRVTLSVDRYYLWTRGRRAVLDLGCPVGVDNVDAYRMISESFRWS